MIYTSTTVAKEEIKPYCSICAKDKNLWDLRTTHTTRQHRCYFDVLGDQ